jgi:hypothetical protein
VITFTEQMERMVQEAGKRPIIFVLLTSGTLKLHAPFSLEIGPATQ